MLNHFNCSQSTSDNSCPTNGYIRDHDIKYLLRRQPANTLCHGPADPWRWAENAGPKENPMKGILSIKTPSDLLAKTFKHLQALRLDPLDDYSAFDFFVSAESLIDWIAPGKKSKIQRMEFRNDDVVLQIVSHIASAAKHYQVEASHHKSVVSTSKSSGHFGSLHFAMNHFNGHHFQKGQWVVKLEGLAEKEIGHVISIVDLAERAYKSLESLVLDWQINKNNSNQQE